MDPLTTQILMQLGMQLANKIPGGKGIMGLFEGEEGSAAERALQQQVGIGQQLIPELQRQAGGGTTPALQASERRLQEEATRAGQTYAASARRRGVAGTIPATAQQGRIQAGMIRGLADIRGRGAQSAQQQLASIYTGAPMQLAAFETSKAEGQRAMYEDIGTIMGYYQSRGEREDDPEGTDMVERFLALLESMYGNGTQKAPMGDFPMIAPGE